MLDWKKRENELQSSLKAEAKMQLNPLTFYEQPELRHPDLVTAFAGWSDAAQAATGTVAYLVKRLDAKRFAEINAEDFYDFSTIRPTITVDRGLITSLKLPRSSFFYWQNQASDHDLVLLHGIEPQLRWQRFVDLILDLAGQLQVHRIYALGGLYDRTPHTREPRISGLVNEPGLLDALEKNGIEVLREARALRPQLQGILITAYPSWEIAVESMKLGAIDYLSKPFNLDTLEKLIQKALVPVETKA